MKRRTLIGSWSCVLGVLLAAASTGATTHGVTFRPTIRIGDERLALVGTGLQRYMLVYRVCVAGFYLPSGTRPEDAFADVPKRLEIGYFHRILGDQFAELTEKIIRRNLSASELRRVSARLEQLNRAYRDVQPGDRYALTYLPGEGTTLTLNGRGLVTIPGADFARAIYSVWLGQRPLSDGLRDSLLGR